MLPMIVNSPAAPLLLMLFFLLLLAFLIWRIYWVRSVQPVLQPLQTLRKALPTTAFAQITQEQWQTIAKSCTPHVGLQRAWQAYHCQLLKDKQSQWRSQYPASHWFGQDSFSADLPPLSFAVVMLILLSIFIGLGWWVWSANVDLSNAQNILNAMRTPNMGALGLLLGGILVSGWLSGRRAAVVQRIERQVRALAQELDTCFPLLGTQHLLEHVLSEQAHQQVFNAALLANAVREGMPAQQTHAIWQEEGQLIRDSLEQFTNHWQNQMQDHDEQQQSSLQAFMEQLNKQQADAKIKQDAAFQQFLSDLQSSLKTPTLGDAITKSASALHDFTQMLGYLNRIIPESLQKSGNELQVQVSKAGEAWQAQLAIPLQQLTQQGETFALHLQNAGEQFSQRLGKIEQTLGQNLQHIEQIQVALVHTAEQLQQTQQPLAQATQSFIQMLPDMHKQTTAANDSIVQIEKISATLQQAVEQQTQGLEQFLEQQKRLGQQFEKHQKYNDGLTERLVETSKSLNYVTSELQERTNLVQTAVIETAEVVTRLENSLQRLPNTETVSH